MVDNAVVVQSFERDKYIAKFTEDSLSPEDTYIRLQALRVALQNQMQYNDEAKFGYKKADPSESGLELPNRVDFALAIAFIDWVRENNYEDRKVNTLFNATTAVNEVTDKFEFSGDHAESQEASCRSLENGMDLANYHKNHKLGQFADALQADINRYAQRKGLSSEDDDEVLEQLTLLNARYPMSELGRGRYSYYGLGSNITSFSAKLFLAIVFAPIAMTLAAGRAFLNSTYNLSQAVGDKAPNEKPYGTKIFNAFRPRTAFGKFCAAVASLPLVVVETATGSVFELARFVLNYDAWPITAKRVFDGLESTMVNIFMLPFTAAYSALYSIYMPFAQFFRGVANGFDEKWLDQQEGDKAYGLRVFKVLGPSTNPIMQGIKTILALALLPVDILVGTVFNMARAIAGYHDWSEEAQSLFNKIENGVYALGAAFEAFIAIIATAGAIAGSFAAVFGGYTASAFTNTFAATTSWLWTGITAAANGIATAIVAGSVGVYNMAVAVGGWMASQATGIFTAGAFKSFSWATIGQITSIMVWPVLAGFGIQRWKGKEEAAAYKIKMDTAKGDFDLSDTGTSSTSIASSSTPPSPAPSSSTLSSHSSSSSISSQPPAAPAAPAAPPQPPQPRTQPGGAANTASTARPLVRRQQPPTRESEAAHRAQQKQQQQQKQPADSGKKKTGRDPKDFKGGGYR